MSGEYFNVEDEGSKLYAEYIKDNHPMSTRKEGKTESDEQLQDLEVQLELAEDRCSALKGQLDYMKNLYSGKPQKISRKFSTVVSKRPVDSSSGDSLQNKTQEMKDEKSHHSEATKNIGNIINGIADSVNRLSDLHLQITDSPHQRTHNENSHVTNIEIKPIKTKISQNMLNSDISTKALKPLKRDYQTGFPKTAKKKDFPLLSCRTDLKRYSSSMIHKNKNRCNAQKLVEIYHNKAVKASDSDHSYHDVRGRSRTSRSHVERVMDIPKLALHVPPVPVTWEQPEQVDAKVNKFNNISNINSIQQHDFKKAMMTDVNQYQLPTIASRMKQVAKCYFNAYNFKAVPFCPATSTSPSHNIGINLQQVMSMMKTKQPISGISPTLAHNIGLAAEKINNSHGSMMITTSSRTCSTHTRPNTCPLSNIRMNYHHLEEMAKAIPEEDLGEAYEENNKESPVITNIITGPSGDMEIKTKKTPEWMADPNSFTQRCTCVPIPGTELHHLVTKYHLNQPPNSSNTLSPQQRSIKSAPRKTRPIRMSLVTKNNGVIRNQKNKNEITDAPPNDADLNITMQNKEKTLKGVLTNLHKEFNTMNNRYEELSKLGEGMSEENVKELEVLDKDLSTKEEEITMVMDLYKEVLALKQQVQTLKRKSSQASVMSQFPRSGSEYNNPKAAFHLTKLLKQIQLYQSHYKKSG